MRIDTTIKGETYSPINLKSKDVSEEFAALLQKKQESGQEAKTFLSSLSAKELYEIQRSNHLAEDIRVNEINEEGAENLFRMPVDKYNTVDLNNDGVVEVGKGKNFIFPPPNMPASVKTAWQDAVKDMSLQERMKLEGRFLARQIEENSYKKADGTWGIYEPGDAGWKNVFGSSASEMVSFCEHIMDRIVHPLEQPTPEQRKSNEKDKKTLETFMKQIRTL